MWDRFRAEFSHLWRTERTGILFPRALYEDQGHTLAAEQALAALLQDIWVDALGFAGVEIHRRILGLAHIAEFEHIEDPDRRARVRGQGAAARPPSRRQPRAAAKFRRRARGGGGWSRGIG